MLAERSKMANDKGVEKSGSKCTVKLTPVVQILIRGQGKRNGICTLDSGGFISPFCKWLQDNNIYTAVKGGMSGGGVYLGFFTAEDATKIEAWLLEQGVEVET